MKSVCVADIITGPVAAFWRLPQSLGLQRNTGSGSVRAQQRDAGPAVHGALQRLQAVDLAFDLAIAPGLADCVLARGQVEAQGAGIPPHAMDPGLRGIA